MPIDRFRGRYWFLSNFYWVDVKYKGILYKTAEHVYQAEKAMSNVDREWIRGSASPGIAKKRGREIAVWADWDVAKLKIMEEIIEAKFKNERLAELLFATGDRELVEGNHWGDTFWGVCRGEGDNHLGRILMKVREGLK